jgi:hypothetical protein
MKLELKYLEPYLPYKLKGFYEMSSTQKKETLQAIDTLGKCRTDEDLRWFDIKMFKPILRPLSDLTKEIEVNGKKFVPITELLRLSGFNVSIMNFEEQLEYLSSFTFLPCINWNDVQKLLEWHFDIYGLIEHNLAIDVNTLNK